MGTPSHHPFLGGVFPEINQPFWGIPIVETPIYPASLYEDLGAAAVLAASAGPALWLWQWHLRSQHDGVGLSVTMPFRGFP